VDQNFRRAETLNGITKFREFQWDDDREVPATAVLPAQLGAADQQGSMPLPTSAVIW